ncbi:MAG: 2-C-methyl-D-erythritol 4-phosphate cytidylyltransferase [Bacteroidaceae bacterium]|nr:2-C-methyl-D-erythritol 4-phosphate cytidylyltransferase [Bacteroidaceae bacterium]
MERYAILVAGGKGLRMGGDIPKQFLPIGGKPVLMRTIEVFRQAYPDIHIILVLPASQQEYWQQLCREYAFSVPFRIADGGETRFHSVSNGLKLVPDDAEGIVGVHDGVRPFVSVETVRRCYDEAVERGAVVPVVSVVETVRQICEDGTSVTVPRDAYKLVQTPQAFRVSLLKEAYRQPYIPAFTDDASVVEALGKPVHLVEGNRENIKITTPADIRFADGLL